MNAKKITLLFSKIFLIFLGSVLGLVIFVILGLNIFKFPYYHEYFSILTKEAKIHGLNEGFTPQGMTYYDNYFITAGYMNDNSSSRIYLTDRNSKVVKYYELTSNNTIFNGHTGGLQYHKNYFYLANEGNEIYKFSADFLSQESGTKVEIGNPIKVYPNASFVFSKDNYIYIGEFHKTPEYPCLNIIEHKNTKHFAIVEKYDESDLSKPIAIYSIPEKIQGFCIKDDGTIILSRSWSVNSSYFYVYEKSDIIKLDHQYRNTDVYFLGEPTKTIKAPAMSEDLDIFLDEKGNEKVLTVFESACNKYIFGKLFFANYIASLNL